MIYPIVAYGDPVLRKVAAELTHDNPPNLPQLIADMFDTMHHAEGIGLAAPQIGLSLRLFVVDGSGTDDEEIKDFKKVFINPVILEQTGEKWGFEEGCLSIPSIREEVMRQSQVRVRYYDENWQLHEETYDGMKARVIQHEYDHIQGILFIDHLNPLKKRLLQSKLAKISKGEVKHNYRMRFPLAKR
ncbi:MAG: peptide deformylase [Cytophagales bacterium]|nr:peptide deformylase [Bernardetiaceae bacterium]MDW8205123.1 peptide deformylase [Cytophagales bacterium]